MLILKNSIEDTAKNEKDFGAKVTISKPAYWIGTADRKTVPKRYVLNKKIKNFMEYVGELNTNDEREIMLYFPSA